MREEGLWAFLLCILDNGTLGVSCVSEKKETRRYKLVRMTLLQRAAEVGCQC